MVINLNSLATKVFFCLSLIVSTALMIKFDPPVFSLLVWLGGVLGASAACCLTSVMGVMALLVSRNHYMDEALRRSGGLESLVDSLFEPIKWAEHLILASLIFYAATFFSFPLLVTATMAIAVAFLATAIFSVLNNLRLIVAFLHASMRGMLLEVYIRGLAMDALEKDEIVPGDEKPTEEK
jgi:hypothetical protein